MADRGGVLVPDHASVAAVQSTPFRVCHFRAQRRKAKLLARFACERLEFFVLVDDANASAFGVDIPEGLAVRRVLDILFVPRADATRAVSVSRRPSLARALSFTRGRPILGGGTITRGSTLA